MSLRFHLGSRRVSTPCVPERVEEAPSESATPECSKPPDDILRGRARARSLRSQSARDMRPIHEGQKEQRRKLVVEGRRRKNTT
eukprot:9186250-Pyramimonas_sp.AAC.1